MTTPTNTDLAAALREIADTLPLGSALIVRLAADRLGGPVADKDGWIEWDPHGPANCPVLDGTKTEVKFEDGDTATDSDPQWWDWGSLPERQIVAYRIVK